MKDEKMVYEAPEMDIIMFVVEDITMSADPEVPEEPETKDNGSDEWGAGEF